ncbi:hypothetical protein [Ponticaulis sp.]|uniref:hypothetical protein n=1 Tax=Ponticaulis sp. TaxID=2020902 RepID=UPI000B662D3E|nr:hypothetical protein [Ponticaulis sp.]MAI91398.1 hypothetical protein [Ponticaulis sp.]OUX97760.1 MAG: hypothetical protein CBB65_13225 [Hyphomonadaceae bacterium TMED5]|tara:strand:- start:4326 stop:5492 length:1167 start_codon:yes stop_codon:yes gene_type:complete
MSERYRSFGASIPRTAWSLTALALIAGATGALTPTALAQAAAPEMTVSPSVQRTVTRTYVRRVDDGSTVSAPSEMTSTATVVTAPRETTTEAAPVTRTYTRYVAPESSQTTSVSAPVDTGTAVSETPRTVTRTYIRTVERTDRSDAIQSAPLRAVSTVTPEPVTPVQPATIASAEPSPEPAVTLRPRQAAPVQMAAIALRSEPVVEAEAPVEIASRPSTPVISAPEPEPERTVLASAAMIEPSQPMIAETPELDVPRIEPDMQPESEDVPELSEIHQILWSTLIVINEAQRERDFDRFMLILSPRMRNEVSPEFLPTHFRALEPYRNEMVEAIGEAAEFDVPPHRLADGRMRLRGSFPMPSGGVRFDLLYELVNDIWYVDAIAFAQRR